MSDGKQKTGNPNVDVAAAMAHKFPVNKFSYAEKDVMLYALAVGAGTDPMDDSELRFVYENHADFQTLPTFGVIIPGGALLEMTSISGLKFNPMMLLHGEQYMEVRKPLPTSATLTNHAKVAGVYDKKVGALVSLDVESKNEQGEAILFNKYSLFIRGLGGFGGDKGPATPANNPPNRQPDAVHTQKTTANQALIYRLTGDTNPLHADPSMAAMGNFPRPILHGLCSFGFAVRAVLKNFADNDASRFKSVRVRFAKHVFPGETLVTEMWKVSDTEIIFVVKVAERNCVVLSNCMVELFPSASSASSSSSSAPSASTEQKQANFASAAVFEALSKKINADIVSKVGASYRFDITKDKNQASWLVDLKNGAGSVRSVPNSTPADCVVGLSDENLVKLLSGQLDAQQAFFQGQLKLSGNMMLAQKLSVLTGKPRSKL